jgi:hypothetical protein
VSDTPETKQMNGPISDEVLMAYADGELPPAEREAVSEALAHDASLMQRFEAFVFTRGPLPRVFDAILAAPVPERLLAIVREPAPVERRAPPRPGSGFLSRVADSLRMAMLSPAGAAAALLIGAAAGWTLQDATRDDLVKLDERGLVATDRLHQALETTPMGGSTGLGRSLTFKATFTFKSVDSTWCRQFDVAGGKGLESGGIACLEDGKWRLIGQGPATPAEQTPGGRTVPADRPDNLLDTMRAQIKEADVLGVPEEKSLIDKGWGSKP